MRKVDIINVKLSVTPSDGLEFLKKFDDFLDKNTKLWNYTFKTESLTDKAYARKMRELGITCETIGKVFGITKQAAHQKSIAMEKDHSKVINMYISGYSIAKISKELGMNKNTIRSILKRNNVFKPYKGARNKDKEVIKLWEKGFLVNEIIKKTGMNQPAVSRAMSRYKLKPHTRKNRRIAAAKFLRNLGWTMKDISKELNVSENAIWRYLN